MEDNEPSCSVVEVLDRQGPFVNDAVAVPAAQILWEFFRYGGINYHDVYVNQRSEINVPVPIRHDAAGAASRYHAA